MNQDKFFKELEKRLDILSEEERNDIINEYKDTLHEKIKHGETEEKAIEDFGSMDELVKEILSAYKINPKYASEDDKLYKASSDLGHSLNRFIKTCSESVSKWFHQISDDMKENGQEITVELVTELVIKGIITLFILAIATIPFNIIRVLGSNILESFFFPLSTVLNVVWVFLIGVLYFCVAALIVIAMFKEYVSPKEERIKKDSQSSKKTKSEKEAKAKKKDEVVTKVNKEKKKSHGISNAIMILVRVWVVLFILAPLCLVIIGNAVCLAIAVYYTCKGLPFIGIDILGLGFLILFLHLTKIITDLTFKRKKIIFYPFIISIVLIAVGGVMTFDLFMSMDYYQTLPTDQFHTTTKEYRISNIDKNTNFYIYGRDFEAVEDSTLNDGEVVVELSYYDDFVTPEYHMSEGGEYSYVTFTTETKEHYVKSIYQQILDGLKEKKIYNYESLDRPTIVEIRANANTMGFVH